MREFTSTPAAEDSEHEPDREFPFMLDKVKFTCVLRGDADSLLGWSELAGTASDEVDIESPEGVAFVARFFQQVMDMAEYRRFRSHLKVRKARPEVLGEIMNEIDAQFREVTEGAAERPTVPPSSSSDGRLDPVARRLQIASLDGTEDGEVTFAARPNRETRRRLEREQQRAARLPVAGDSAATG